MIAGNVCLNRLYGIIYPAFVLGGTKQPIPPVVSFDSSTLLNEVTTTTTTSDIAINPIAVLSKTTKTETTPGKATTRIDSREIMLTPQNTVVDGNKVTIVLEDGKTVVANLADLTRDQAMAILGRTPGANFTVVQTVTEVGTAITTTVTTGAEGFNKLIAAIAVLL